MDIIVDNGEFTQFHLVFVIIVDDGARFGCRATNGNFLVDFCRFCPLFGPRWMTATLKTIPVALALSTRPTADVPCGPLTKHELDNWQVLTLNASNAVQFGPDHHVFDESCTSPSCVLLRLIYYVFRVGFNHVTFNATVWPLQYTMVTFHIAVQQYGFVALL